MKMNKRYIDYAHYNIWANNRIIRDVLKQEAIIDKELVGSFPTIKATMMHIWYAETVWLSRMNGMGWEVSAVTEFSGTTSELIKSWKNTSEAFKNFVEKADLEQEIQLEHKGQQFSIPNREMIQTVFNHGSFHRGQIVMMMRQLGITEIAQTDYIEWVREQERTKF